MICRSINLQMRALRNAQVEKVLEVEARRGGLEELIPLIGGERQSAAWESGDLDSSPFPVGQSIGLIQDIVTCEELLSTMMREAGEVLAHVQERFVGGPAT
jgi:nitronate monooxygenase